MIFLRGWKSNCGPVTDPPQLYFWTVGIWTWERAVVGGFWQWKKFVPAGKKAATICAVTWGSRHGQLLKSDFSLKGFPVRKPGSWMWHKKGARRDPFFFLILYVCFGESSFFFPFSSFSCFFFFQGSFPRHRCVRIYFSGNPRKPKDHVPKFYPPQLQRLLVGLDPEWVMLTDSQTPAYE